MLSVFGVTFAPDPAAAAAELARVTAPDGRIVLSAWIPGGAVGKATRVAVETVRRARGAPAPPPPFTWRERARAYLDAEHANQPLSVAAKGVLEAQDKLEALRERLLAIFEAANEHPHAFRVTSRYVVATARR